MASTKTLSRRWDKVPVCGTGRVVYIGRDPFESEGAVFIFPDGTALVRLWDCEPVLVETLDIAAAMLGGTHQVDIAELSELLTSYAADFYASQEKA